MRTFLAMKERYSTETLVKRMILGSELTHNPLFDEIIHSLS